MGQQVQDELLVGLAAREDPHVAQGCGGEQAAQQVQGLRGDRPAVGRAGLAVRRRIGTVGPRDDARQAVRVDPEDLVHRGLVGGAELLVAVVAVPRFGLGGVHRGVVGDVARGLLEVGPQPRALQDLREDVGGPLAGDVRAPELGDGVVAVADEDPLVEVGGAAALVALPGRGGRRGAQRVGELVEEEAPQRALVARVAGEERALHRLRQADQREHGLIEVRDVRREQRALVGGEGFDRVEHGRGSLASRSAGAACGRVLRDETAAGCDLAPCARRCLARRPRASTRTSARAGSFRGTSWTTTWSRTP